MGAGAEPCPTRRWRGINLHTAENLRFAATSQLFQTYLSCLKLPVLPGTVHAWLMGSYQGPLSPGGLPDGEGSAQLLDGLTYTGTFKGGLLHGHGTLTKANSWSYTGTFSHNCIHGSGMYRWAHEAFYNGQVYQGLPHGDGFMYTGEEDSCTYEGAWKHGLRHGQGKLIFGKNGTTKYEGRWVLDHKHGDGYHTYDSGSTFKGSWLQGKRNGKGRLVSLCSSKPSSCSYRGELGRLNLTQVYVYEGDWMDELSSGSGKSVWMGNEQEEASNRLLNRYVGDFERGIRHGHGTFYYASGAIYKGGWMENRKNGDGCYIHENGTIVCGEFINDHVNQMEGGPLLKEPLQSLLENEGNLALLKERVSNVLMRHNSILRDVFSMYSHMMKGERKGQRSNAPCTPHAILLDQIWQLCYDGNIVQCGLGLAQIDWLLRPTQTSWDSSPEIHKPNRQFIFREFIESVIIISKVIFSAEEFPLDEKVDKMVTKHFIPLLSKDYGGCSNVLMDVDSMRSVFDGYAPQLQKLFNETLRGIGTSDETITLRALDLFFQRYKPQWGLQRERLLFNLIKGLYQNEIGFGDDGALYLDNDINFIEFQIAIFIYATNIKDQGVSVEPIIMLNNLIKEAILPNLSTDLESLMNEDLIPNLPNINTKDSNGNSTSKTPRSVPGSKRSTPREGKIPPGAKSAPQTPLKKKH